MLRNLDAQFVTTKPQAVAALTSLLVLDSIVPPAFSADRRPAL